MATDALDDWRCLYDSAFWPVSNHHLMDVCDTKRAVTDGGCKSVDDELLSFTQERKQLSFFKSPSTSSKLALMLPCSMIASMMFPYRFIAFRSLWLVTFAYATSNMPQFFCFGLLLRGLPRL